MKEIKPNSNNFFFFRYKDHEINIRNALRKIPFKYLLGARVHPYMHFTRLKYHTV